MRWIKEKRIWIQRGNRRHTCIHILTQHTYCHKAGSVLSLRRWLCRLLLLLLLSAVTYTTATSEICLSSNTPAEDLFPPGQTYGHGHIETAWDPDWSKLIVSFWSTSIIITLPISLFLWFLLLPLTTAQEVSCSSSVALFKQHTLYGRPVLVESRAKCSSVFVTYKQHMNVLM